MSRADVERAELRRAIERLYETFAIYPLRASMSSCPHCHEPDDEHKLRARPLRELTSDDLAAYAASATLTWGDELDFKHFLPRIFELAATGDLDGPDLEVVYATPGRAGWRAWPIAEQRAVEEYLLASWRVTLAEFPSTHDAGVVLCAIAQSVTDMRPFLGVWRDAEGQAPARHLAALLWRDGNHLVRAGSLSNAFWSGEQRAQQEQIRDWLRDPEVHARLESAFFAATSSDVAEVLSTAVAILEAVRR